MFIINPYLFNVIISATGGTITEDGGYRIHTFNSSADFIVTGGGSLSVDYLLVAGGGGGCPGTTADNGGNGGSGVVIIRYLI